MFSGDAMVSIPVCGLLTQPADHELRNNYGNLINANFKQMVRSFADLALKNLPKPAASNFSFVFGRGEHAVALEQKSAFLFV